MSCKNANFYPFDPFDINDSFINTVRFYKYSKIPKTIFLLRSYFTTIKIIFENLNQKHRVLEVVIYKMKIP